MSCVKRAIAMAAHRILGNYGIFYVLAHHCHDPVDTGQDSTYNFAQAQPDMLQSSDSPEIRNLATYAREKDCRLYVLRGATGIVSGCGVWYGELYRRERNFWPLRDDEAKLLALVTPSEYRGKGLATRLLQLTTDQLHKDGFAAVYARVWHSHRASLRAFNKAQWSKVALVVDMYPMGRKLRFLRRIAQ